MMKDRLYIKPMIVVISIYFSTLVIGFFLSNTVLGNNFDYVPKDLKESHVNIDTMFHILINNLKVFLIILTGFFLLKIPTVLNLISNGTMLGFFLGGLPEGELLKVIPPLLAHGIPEILGFFIAAYLVFLGKQRFKDKKQFNTTLLLIAVLLIVVGSFIETYISPIFL
jgi:stage II sporulation protein M